MVVVHKNNYVKLQTSRIFELSLALQDGRQLTESHARRENMLSLP